MTTDGLRAWLPDLAFVFAIAIGYVPEGLAFTRTGTRRTYVAFRLACLGAHRGPPGHRALLSDAGRGS